MITRKTTLHHKLLFPKHQTHVDADFNHENLHLDEFQQTFRFTFFFVYLISSDDEKKLKPRWKCEEKKKFSVEWCFSRGRDELFTLEVSLAATWDETFQASAENQIFDWKDLKINSFNLRIYFRFWFEKSFLIFDKIRSGSLTKYVQPEKGLERKERKNSTEFIFFLRIYLKLRLIALGRFVSIKGAKHHKKNQNETSFVNSP